MEKRVWNSLLFSPALLGTLMATATFAGESQQASQPLPTAQALTAAPRQLQAEFIETQTSETQTSVSSLAVDAANGEANSMGQVTSVSQLTDVKPTDWAFQALQSLVERYGCIAGYPNKTFRGNTSLSRYEFAAGMNACLDKINDLIAAGTADLVKKEDLEILKKLQEEFAAELATLRGRVDALEARTTTLEKQQFSTTTKLNGEVVFALAGVAAGNTVNGNKVQKNTVLGDRVRLNFDTSFSGRDLLRTRLQAGNLGFFSGNASFTREGDFRFAGLNGNIVNIDALLYQFPLGEKTTVTLEANAGAADDFAPTLNPFLDGDGGSGALTQFGTRNAIYYLVNGAGVGVQHNFSDKLSLSLGYLANSPNTPTAGNGLFNGPYGAIAQLTFKPSEKLGLGVTYIHAYNNDFTANGSTGSTNANFSNTGDRFSSNAYGAQATFQISPQIILNGSVGYTNSRFLTGDRGSANVWNWAVGLAFPDLGKKGSVAGIIVGMEPKVTSTSANRAALKDPNTSIHIEGFYQFQLTDNIAITPGIVWLTAPDHNKNNSDIVIGVIRTTFTF